MGLPRQPEPEAVVTSWLELLVWLPIQAGCRIGSMAAGISDQASWGGSLEAMLPSGAGMLTCGPAQLGPTHACVLWPGLLVR